MLHNFKKEGIGVGVFGEIDLEEHREWVERVCSSVGIYPYEPLWKKARKDLLRELFEFGFKATIIAVKENVLDKQFLGKNLSIDLMEEFEEMGLMPVEKKESIIR